MIRILLNTSIVFFNSQFLFNLLGGLVLSGLINIVFHLTIAFIIL